jgi:ABC-type anion transport system duplicated permease subunit
MRSIASLAYVVIGLIIANQHHYLVHLTTVLRALSAFLAIVLWPLILLHFNLHLH